MDDDPLLMDTDGNFVADDEIYEIIWTDFLEEGESRDIGVALISCRDKERGPMLCNQMAF